MSHGSSRVVELDEVELESSTSGTDKLLPSSSFSSSSSPSFVSIRTLLIAVVTLLAVIALLALIGLLVLAGSSHKDTVCCAPPPSPSPPPLPGPASGAGAHYCKPRGGAPPVQYAAHPVVHIRNAELWTGKGQRLQGDLLLERGKITQIGTLLQVPAGAVVVESEGRVVTPGLVDMHSHLGVYALPELQATQDGNEMTNPTLPQVRALDAFDPEDSALPLVLGGGVTTVQVLPGSGNVMGGEGSLFKLKLNRKTVQNMLITDAPTSLKMACGENPKRFYGGKGQTPMSRMGSAWLMRSKFFEAQEAMFRQDEWCASLQTETPNTSPYPRDLALDSLILLLRGVSKLNVHCYQVHDLEMMIRLSKEFNFSISAFHHALESYKIPDLIRENNITVAIFSDLWGYKLEAYDGSVYAPKILADAGVTLALKSDHPVLFSRDLLLEAAKASQAYGLDEEHAIAAITSVPAKTIGLGDRIGSLEVGKDADIVIWDRNPFLLGAKPMQVYIEGILLVNNSAPKVDTPPIKNYQLSSATKAMCSDENLESYMIRNVTVYTMQASEPLEQTNLYVLHGKVFCIGKDCQEVDVPGGTVHFDFSGGVVFPGFLESGAPIGLFEIGAEGDTQDGYTSGTELETSEILALDGVHLLTRHAHSAWAAGVTGGVVAPLGNSLVSGMASAFLVYGKVVDDNTIKPKVGIQVVVGNRAKSRGTPSSSISGQIRTLRHLLHTAQMSNTSNAFVSVLKREIPMIARMHQADDISAVLRLQREFGFRLVIVGGAEAYIIADELAASNVGVVLAPARCIPNSWETRRCSDRGVETLHKAGVLIGLGTGDEDNVRNLRWEAGLAREQGLSLVEALRTITANIAEMFQLESVGKIKLMEAANFVAFSGDPTSLTSTVELVAVGKRVECQPRQGTWNL